MVQMHHLTGPPIAAGSTVKTNQVFFAMSTAELSDFSDLLLTLYRLAHEKSIDSFQDAALNLVKPVVPFDSSMWGTATMTPTGVDIHTIHLHRSPPEMLLEYERHKASDTAAQSVLQHRTATGRFHTPAAIQDPGLRDFLGRYGHENIFITAITNPATQFVHAISLFRAQRDAHGQEDERKWLGHLRPHLMQALALNRSIHLRGWAPAETGLQRGLAVADLRGVVYQADPHFETLLRAEWPGWPGGALPQALLKSLLSAEDAYAGAMLVVRGHAQHGLLFLRARQLCRADLLSPREREVAKLMAQGCTHKQVAQRLCRAPATVRNHLQSVYGKLEVSNVAAMIEALRLVD